MELEEFIKLCDKNGLDYRHNTWPKAQITDWAVLDYSKYSQTCHLVITNGNVAGTTIIGELHTPEKFKECVVAVRRLNEIFS